MTDLALSLRPLASRPYRLMWAGSTTSALGDALVQIALIAGAIEWLRTLAGLISTRMATGAPFTRLVLILASVALVTCASALVFRAAKLRARYR